VRENPISTGTDGWQRDGRHVYGAAGAWRQWDDLAATGIAEADRAAFSVFLDRVTKAHARLRRSGGRAWPAGHAGDDRLQGAH